jgi:hypothetical protein
MAYENDPPEFTGTAPGISADPIQRGAPDRVKKPKLGIFPGKVATGNPSDDHKAAVQETFDARAALIQIQNQHRAAEEAEGVAVIDWMRLNRPSADSVTREYLAREGAMRQENCLAGRDPNYRGEAPEASSQWPIQQAARARGRHAGGNRQQAGVPLRSNISRRNV